MEQKRIMYLDYLRVFAIIAVVILHVAAQNWYGLGGRSYEWNVLNFYDSLVRWGVPIFVMISGSLFLNRDIDIKTIYKNNIFKLVVVYAVWSIFYALFVPLDDFLLFLSGNFPIKSFVFKVIEGSYHMWFVPMIIGLYMIIPILKKIVESLEIMRYFMILSLVFSFIIPQLVMISNDFIGGNIADVMNKINIFISTMAPQVVFGFSFYFILGYYLNKINLVRKQRVIVYFLGFVGFLSTILLNAFVAWKSGIPCQSYYNNFSVNVLFEAVAVHTFFKYRVYDNYMFNNIILNFSKYSFGAYLVHVFVIELFNVLGLNTLIFNPVVSIPIISVIIIFFSFLISILLNNIPKIKKWIV